MNITKRKVAVLVASILAVVGLAFAVAGGASASTEAGTVTHSARVVSSNPQPGQIDAHTGWIVKANIGPTLSTPKAGIAGPNSTETPDTWYGSSDCFNDPNDSTTNGTWIQGWSCQYTENNAWHEEYIHGSSGPVALVEHNGKCADLANDSGNNGTKIQIWTCLGDLSQSWSDTGTNGGATHTFVNSGQDICLDLTGDNFSNGTKFQGWTCNGKQSQDYEWYGGSNAYDWYWLLPAYNS